MSQNTANPREEELQLLLQLNREPRRRVVTSHSATQEIARRLADKDECLYFAIHSGPDGRSTWGIEITAKGRRTMGVKIDG